MLDTVRCICEDNADVTLNYKSTEFRTFFKTTLVPTCMVTLLQLEDIGDNDKVLTSRFMLIARD